MNPCKICSPSKQLETNVKFAAKRAGSKHEEDIKPGDGRPVCKVCGVIEENMELTPTVLRWHGDSFPMTSRKFYKTRYVIEVLSEEPIPEVMDISQVIAEATDGNFSLDVTHITKTELDGKQAARALWKQGSATEFFQLDKDGRDTTVFNILAKPKTP